MVTLNQPDVERNDKLFTGAVTMTGAVNLPANSVGNDQADTSDPIDAAKLKHGIHGTYSQEAATEAAVDSKKIHIARAPGEVIAFECVCEVLAGGDKTAVFDLQKSTGGGAFASVLTGTVTLSSATPVRVVVAGAIASAAYVAGDIFRIVITRAGSTSTYPAGIGCSWVFHEAPAAA